MNALRDSPASDCSAERKAASGRTESGLRSTSVQALLIRMIEPPEVEARLPGDGSGYKRKGSEQERSALLEVSRKRCCGLSGSIAEVSECEESPVEELFISTSLTDKLHAHKSSPDFPA